MLRKIVQLFIILLLFWILSILVIVRKFKFMNKNIIDEYYGNDQFVELRDYSDDIPARFRKSDFRVWKIMPSVNGKLTLDERYSLIKDQHNPPGIDGTPVILNDNLKIHERAEVRRGWNEHAFNNFVSDVIPINRTLPDVRDAWCKNRNISNKLPEVAVVICFHNEANSTLLRTLHSVLVRSPDNLLKEVILIDDASTMKHLKSPLKKYVKTIPKVTLIETNYRQGLIRARMLGAKRAKAPVLVFLDSHCECTKGWLEPLIERISDDPTKVVSPVIDRIHVSTFEYIAQDVDDLRIGGFTWDLKFSWISIPSKVYAKRDNDAAPIQTPTISGGLFAIDKKFFEKLGYYDEEFDIWGAENLELSFKVWMCGGSLEIIPCSHVGHVFRNTFPYKGIKGSSKRNNVRLAEVWLDDYAKYFYERIGNNKGNFGDIAKRKSLRNTLKCKSFKWYLENVYPELIIPNNYVASGQIISLNYDDWCLDASSRLLTLKYSVSLLPCHHAGGNQFWVYTQDGEIQRNNLCLDYMFNIITLYLCRGKASSQIWHYDEKTKTIRHTKSRMCLTATKTRNKYIVVLMHCIKVYSQKWTMEHFVSQRLLPEVQNYG